MKLDKKQYTILGAILVLACSVSFYAGTQFGSKKANPIDERAPFGQNSEGMRNGNGGNKGQFGRNSTMNRGVFGEIISNDGTTMTVKLRDGGSRIVLLTGSTKVEKSMEGDTSDLASGKSIVVSGEQNPDGSFTADSVQIRQMDRLFIQENNNKQGEQSKQMPR